MARFEPAEGRRWNTWDARHPGAFVHVSTGFSIRVSAFSTREGRATEFPFDPATMRLGAHATDGSYAELETTHAGSRLRVRFATGGEGAAVGDVEVLETGEWALRFWYLLEAGFDPAFGDGTVRLVGQSRSAAYVEPPVAEGVAAVRADGRGGGGVAFLPAVRPVGAHLYEDPSAAGHEMEAFGYYSRPPASAGGHWAVYRFNAVTPRTAFAAAAGPDAETAFFLARMALSGATAVLDGRSTALAGESPARAAIRDVVGWNTVWDTVNGRPYTVATRSWAADRFGGWFVWQSDAFFHAILSAACGDLELARWNLEAGLSCATEHGNLAGLRSGLTDWVDRSHPPIGGHAAWELFRRGGDRAILERAYPVLARAFDWWFEARDGNGNGLLEYGSSPVGDGHFVHTKLAAMDESSNDNSPVHDEASFDATTHTLDVEDVGLNSLLVFEGENLSSMARVLGRDDEAAAFADRAAALAERVRVRLWDDERGIFANRRWDGRFVRSLAPTSFYPLVAGVATQEQAGRMVRDHLLNPDRFWGEFPVAGTPHDDPAAGDNVYWRGRVWPPFNYLVTAGLIRYGYLAEAAELAARSRSLFERGWAERRSWENMNQRTGEGGDVPDADPFYTWGALLPLLSEMLPSPTSPSER